MQLQLLLSSVRPARGLFGGRAEWQMIIQNLTQDCGQFRRCSILNLSKHLWFPTFLVVSRVSNLQRLGINWMISRLKLFFGLFNT